MGINNAELWCNIGLCCFYASQYDMTLSCFHRALSMASDDVMADIWYCILNLFHSSILNILMNTTRYNIGQVAIGIGDLGLAFQAFNVAISVDGNHAESINNLGVRNNIL